MLVVADAASFMRHTDVGFIDSVTCLGLSRDWIWVLPLMLVYGWWVPVHTVEQSRIALYLPMSPARISVHSALICSDDMEFVFLSVFDSRTSIWKSFQRDGPAAKVISVAPKLVSVPSVEVTED